MSNSQATPQELTPLEKVGAPGLLSNDALDKMNNQINEIRSSQVMPEIALGAKPTASELPALSIGQFAEQTANQELEQIKEVDIKEMLRKELPPLSRTENLLLRGLTSEVKNADLQGTQEMLSTLAENPAAAARVLDRFKQQTEAANYLRHVSYVIGKDSNGQPFIQLSISQRDHAGKSAPYSTVTMDNQGQARASRSEVPWKPAYSVDPATTFNDMIDRARPPKIAPYYSEEAPYKKK